MTTVHSLTITCYLSSLLLQIRHNCTTMSSLPVMCQSLEGIIYVPRAHAESVWLLRTLFSMYRSFVDLGTVTLSSTLGTALSRTLDAGACTHARRGDTRISGMEPRRSPDLRGRARHRRDDDSSSICNKDLAAVSTNPRQDTACFKEVGQLQHDLWLSYDQSSLRNCQWRGGLISVAQQFVLLIAAGILVNLERIIVRQRLYQPQKIIIALRQELSKLFPPI